MTPLVDPGRDNGSAGPDIEIDLTDAAVAIAGEPEITYESEITLESGETLESGIVVPLRR